MKGKVIQYAIYLCVFLFPCSVLDKKDLGPLHLAHVNVTIGFVWTLFFRCWSSKQRQNISPTVFSILMFVCQHESKFSIGKDCSQICKIEYVQTLYALWGQSGKFFLETFLTDF